VPEYSVIPIHGIGEVAPGTELSELVELGRPQPGDIVLITSKIVSKSQGRISTQERAEAIASETKRIVAQRNGTTITENHLGLTMAASGVDSSNVAPDSVLLLPEDPDRTARQIRAALTVNVGVVITDTAGRPWRNGQTDIAIGVAGIPPLLSFTGVADNHGNQLAVTAPAIADELASAAELATGKLGWAPIALVRGLAEYVLERGLDGPGARELIRDRSADMFALGTREAVMAALTNTQLDCFGAPASSEEVLSALESIGVQATPGQVGWQLPSIDQGTLARVRLVATAHSWSLVEDSSTDPPQRLELVPYTSTP